jgi:selenocysteine lyase/cysteine desulfurase
VNQTETFDFKFLRNQLIGADAQISTPFGERLMVYGDYTASGRCLALVEHYLQNLQRIYANTHTEDDITGRSMTNLLEEAEHHIKASVNAGPDGRIIACGTGATGAIDKFQQIIGIALPPATRQKLELLLKQYVGPEREDGFRSFIKDHQPVVFVGPYEHHSNEISWRQNLATVVPVDLADDGGIDLDDLERKLQNPVYRDRMCVGSFSAASNVTGMISPVHEIACLLHKYGAMACFDYAASAPYVEIDMNPQGHGLDGDPSQDAIFISPHKFLGGPGSSGILVFNSQLYHRELPPCVSAGGTVDYVGPSSQDFIEQIEEREKPGTPGVLQTLKAALAFQVKDHLGVARIEEREHQLMERAFQRWIAHPKVEILGNQDPARRIGIISFNVKGAGDRYLHPKFVTTLLNDLFGIQTRAGCSCAGPYGHRLLNIGDEMSQKYRDWITRGYSGVKPGWSRVSLHYVMDDLELDYILDAVEFVAEQGSHFMQLYDFDLCTGAWQHKKDPVVLQEFSLDTALNCSREVSTSLEFEKRQHFYQAAMREALELAEELEQRGAAPEIVLNGELGELQFFSLPEGCLTTQSREMAREARGGR